MQQIFILVQEKSKPGEIVKVSNSFWKLTFTGVYQERIEDSEKYTISKASSKI